MVDQINEFWGEKNFNKLFERKLNQKYNKNMMKIIVSFIEIFFFCPVARSSNPMNFINNLTANFLEYCSRRQIGLFNRGCDSRT